MATAWRKHSILLNFLNFLTHCKKEPAGVGFCNYHEKAPPALAWRPTGQKCSGQKGPQGIKSEGSQGWKELET
jgi:hypothetical protein